MSMNRNRDEFVLVALVLLAAFISSRWFIQGILVAGLCTLVWFLGPLIAVSGLNLTEEPSIRWAIMGLIVLSWLTRRLLPSSVKRVLRKLVSMSLIIGGGTSAALLAFDESIAAWWHPPAADIHNLDPEHLAPEMVVIPAGEFLMGTAGASNDESPQHKVSIAAFAIGRFEVTFEEYDAFAKATSRNKPPDLGWGRGTRPVINVSWDDAQAYAAWLSEKTGKKYRLPTEAEWEYAARAGSQTDYWWGDEIQQAGQPYANCRGCGSPWDNLRKAPVGAFPGNAFGLHDTAGNVWEWVQDCYHNSYQGAPSDGSAWEDKGGCDSGRRVLRGGSWFHKPYSVRSASRDRYGPAYGISYWGFRLARTL